MAVLTSTSTTLTGCSESFILDLSI
jgi:hypothetical protein